MRCLEDTVNLFAWFMLPDKKDEFEAQLGDFYTAVDFQGGKLQSSDMDKKWFRALRDVQKAIFEFIKPKFPQILQWTGNQPGATAFFNKACSGGVPIKEAPKEEVKEDKKPVAKAPVKAAPVPKKPTKIQRGKTWEVSNYVNEKVVFTEEEVNMPGMTFNFFNCEKTKVKIPGKIKNFMLMRCKKFDIEIDEAVSMGEILRSEQVKLYVNTSLRTVSIELSQGIQIWPTL